MNPAVENNEDQDIDFTPENQDDQQQQQQADPTKSVEPSKLESAMAELATTVKQIATQPKQDQQQQQKARSPEEEDEFWGVWNPTKANKNYIKELFNLPDDVAPEVVERIGARFAEMQKGLVRQSVISARRLFEERLSQLEPRLKNSEEYISRSEAQATRGRFFEAYPALHEDRFQKVINAVASDLANQEFTDEKEYFKALAEGAGASIKELIPDFDLTAKQNKEKPAGTTPRLPRGGAGGGGGAGGKGTQSTVKGDPQDAADSILD